VVFRPHSLITCSMAASNEVADGQGVKVLTTRLLGRVPNNEQVFNKVCPPKQLTSYPSEGM